MGMMHRHNVMARAAQTAQPIVEVVVTDTLDTYETTTLSDKVKASGLRRTEINRMTTAELRELAESFGIEGADEMSGNQIKKTLNATFEE